MRRNRLTFVMILCLFIMGITARLNAQPSNPAKKQILLIGTFHFNNPNADAVKTTHFDITTAAIQLELDHIAAQIANFKPDRVFVEWEYNDQQHLDSLYQLYLKNQYQTYIDKTYGHQPRYELYAQNEIFQLAFRAAKKANLKQVDGMDYPLPMPFDTVMNAIKDAGQNNLMTAISTFIASLEKDSNHKRKTLNLTSLLLDLNTEKSRKENNSIYLKTLTKVGKPGNFAGAFSVAEWYRRNLYMYAIFQKKLVASDQKAVMLLGAGHIAMIKKFLQEDEDFEIIELKDILK